MLRHLLAAGSLGVLLVTTLICSATSSAASVELKHQLEGPCVSPITNNKIGQTKIGTDVCLDGKVQDPNKKDEKDDNNDGSDQSNQSVSSDEESATVCDWYPLDEDMSSTRWGSNSPGDGHLEGLKCYPRDLDLTKQGEGGGSALVDTRFVQNAGPIQPVAPPPPDPAVLAEQAYSELEVPPPTIGAGPDRTKLAVNLWTWLWVDNPGPLTNTVTAGGISVTVIAVLSSVDWSLGEPTTAGDTFAAGPPAKLTCQGTGTPPPTGYDWKAQPPCGYRFHWRSLKERTGGAGKWPIQATSTWDVTWQANTGATGATTLTATANDQFDVAEYRTVLVQRGAGG